MSNRHKILWGDFLGLFDQKLSYKHMSHNEELRIYNHLKLIIKVLLKTLGMTDKHINWYKFDI